MRNKYVNYRYNEYVIYLIIFRKKYLVYWILRKKLKFNSKSEPTYYFISIML